MEFQTNLPNWIPPKIKKLLRVLNRRRFVVSIIFGMLTIIGTLLGIQSIQANRLRIAARKIRIGDDILAVDNFLGGSHYGYECGWPSAGAAPAEFGNMYGGSLNELHEQLNSFVCHSPFGTQWYNSSLSQNTMDWPVLVQYNRDQRVTAVFIDGRNIMP